MNNIRAIEALNQRELEAGVPLSASWHTDWSDTAYVFIGGLPYELSEGDIITIFSQFGEPVHVNLVRDKDTGKSKGFAFLKYEDQRSTNLAVDNLGGATILGRIIRVDHTRYKPKEGEVVDENSHANAGTRAKNEDDQVRPVKRRRGDVSSEDERGWRTKAPSREMLKEELELQKLIREHDEDDPMKEYLIREKKEEVQKALEKLKMDKKSSKHRHHSGRGSKNEHRHRSHRHRSRSREPSRRHRSRSADRRNSTKAIEETRRPRDNVREAHRDRVGDKDQVRDRDSRRERDDDREGGGIRDGNKERERGQGKDINEEKDRIRHQGRERTEITRKERYGDDR